MRYRRLFEALDLVANAIVILLSIAVVCLAVTGAISGELATRVWLVILGVFVVSLVPWWLGRGK